MCLRQFSCCSNTLSIRTSTFNTHLFLFFCSCFVNSKQNANWKMQDLCFYEWTACMDVFNLVFLLFYTLCILLSSTPNVYKVRIRFISKARATVLCTMIISASTKSYWFYFFVFIKLTGCPHHTHYGR